MLLILLTVVDPLYKTYLQCSDEKWYGKDEQRGGFLGYSYLYRRKITIYG